jgi:hypothetical protein
VVAPLVPLPFLRLAFIWNFARGTKLTHHRGIILVGTGSFAWYTRLQIFLRDRRQWPSNDSNGNPFRTAIPDGTFDSICLDCFRTIAHQENEEDLIWFEREHMCEGLRYVFQAGFYGERAD